MVTRVNDDTGTRPGIKLLGVPNFLECRVPVSSSYRTLPERSVEGIEAGPNLTQDFGRAFTEQIPSVYLGTYPTNTKTL